MRSLSTRETVLRVIDLKMVPESGLSILGDPIEGGKLFSDGEQIGTVISLAWSVIWGPKDKKGTRFPAGYIKHIAYEPDAVPQESIDGHRKLVESS